MTYRQEQLGLEPAELTGVKALCSDGTGLSKQETVVGNMETVVGKKRIVVEKGIRVVNKCGIIGMNIFFILIEFQDFERRKEATQSKRYCMDQLLPIVPRIIR